MGEEIFSHNGHEYDVRALWPLTAHLEVRQLVIGALIPMLDQECWETQQGIRITPAQVVRSFITLQCSYQEHWDRVMSADITKPILVDEDLCVIDGMHRLCYFHYILQANVVPVRIVGRQLLERVRIHRQC